MYDDVVDIRRRRPPAAACLSACVSALALAASMWLCVCEAAPPDCGQL